jgi:hypothetical protein
MERTPVTSSQLVSVGYDPGTQTLEVEFKGGTGRDGAARPNTVYQYSAVPPEVHKAMMAAESQGSYLYKHIKGAYAYTKVG